LLCGVANAIESHNNHKNEWFLRRDE
jgi:hypothetical protein